MAVSDAFIDEAQALFAPFGHVRARRMFGGAGLYCDDLFFAILDDGVIYLKVDDETRPAFEARGLEAFRFEMKDGSIETMSYYPPPAEAYEDADELRRWAHLALDAAARAARFKKKRAAAVRPAKNSPQANRRSAASRRSTQRK